jgi:hypothetical protein
VDHFQGRRSSPETPRSEHHHTVRIFRYGVFVGGSARGEGAKSTTGAVVLPAVIPDSSGDTRFN